MGGVRDRPDHVDHARDGPETGELHAELALALDPDVEPLPEDSTVTVRARSALGLKYLELAPGELGRGLRVGRRSSRFRRREPAGDIDDFLETFDEPTRIAVAGEPGGVRQCPGRSRAD